MGKSTEIKMPTNELTHAQRTGMRSKWTGKKNKIDKELQCEEATTTIVAALGH